MSTGDFILDELLKQHAEQAEVIRRVHELADKFDSSSHYTGHFVTDAILKTLDGE